MIPRHKIFVSTPMDDFLDPKRLAIKKAILAALVAEGFEPQIFFHSGLPAGLGWNFEHANRVMSQCQATVVLAFVRWQGTDSHGRSLPLASEYSHFEGALAVAHELPLLIVSEKGIADRGIATMGGGLPIHFIPPGGDGGWVTEPWFATRFAAWAKDVKSRPRVFLGYCGKAKPTAAAITLYLEHTLGVSVRNYAMDFVPGGTILEEIEKSARICSCGIFLFTKDDPLAGPDPNSAAPRDNVVFEAGFFMHAKGKDRCLIIREEGAKMPADIGGNIYLALKDRQDISSIETPLRQFLEDRL